MNQMVTISYEDQLKAKAKAVRERLMGKPKVVNFAKEVIREANARKFSARSRPRADADAHVRAWQAYHARVANQITIEDYRQQVCDQQGFDIDVIMGPNRQDHIVRQRDFVIFEVHMMFPTVAKLELARRFGRDNSTIRQSLSREAARRGVDEEDLTSIERVYPTLREDVAQGLSVNRRRNGTPYRLPKGTPASSCIGSARVGPGLSI